MGTRSTITGYWRQRGNSSNTSRTGPTPATLLAQVSVVFSPTAAATAPTGIYLPKGAVPSFAKITVAGATGGVSPTVDVGLAGGSQDALIAEGDADTASAAILTTGLSLDVALTADTQITAGQGASAATGGVVAVSVFYYISDDQLLAD